MAPALLSIGLAIALIVAFRRGVGEAYAGFPWGWWLAADMTAIGLILAGAGMIELQIVMWAMA